MSSTRMEFRSTKVNSSQSRGGDRLLRADSQSVKRSVVGASRRKCSIWGPGKVSAGKAHRKGISKTTSEFTVHTQKEHIPGKKKSCSVLNYII